MSQINAVLVTIPTLSLLGSNSNKEYAHLCLGIRIFPIRPFLGGTSGPRPLGPRPGASPGRGSPLLPASLSPAVPAGTGVSRPSSAHAVSKGQVGGGLGDLPAGTGGSSGEASFKARDETGSFPPDPGFGGHLEKTLGVRGPRVAPCFLPSLLSLESHIELVVEILAAQARGPGAWVGL